MTGKGIIVVFSALNCAHQRVHYSWAMWAKLHYSHTHDGVTVPIDRFESSYYNLLALRVPSTVLDRSVP